jgi:hypothetical protein
MDYYLWHYISFVAVHYRMHKVFLPVVRGCFFLIEFEKDSTFGRIGGIFVARILIFAYNTVHNAIAIYLQYPNECRDLIVFIVITVVVAWIQLFQYAHPIQIDLLILNVNQQILLRRSCPLYPKFFLLMYALST